MEAVAKELEGIVNSFATKFLSIPDSEFQVKPNPAKWSKQEVVGHLIDSAQNNLRRFIVAQYETESKIIYEQEFWVRASGYQNQKKENVIELWRLLNLQICSVLKSIPRENYSRTSDTRRESKQLRTIEWLAPDYVKHLKHHINQVVPSSFDVTYP